MTRVSFLTTLLALALFAGLTIPVPVAAQSGSQTLCDQYARNAVAQQQLNLNRGCGFSGGQGGAGWGSDYRAHYDWCRRVSVATSAHHTQIRNSMLSHCQPRMYKSRWDKVSGPGGGWTTGWVPNVSSPICGHGANGCSCGGRNYCGTYKSGQSTYWWPYGCNGPAWIIRCTSVPQ
jgi:hypothetical protein